MEINTPTSKNKQQQQQGGGQINDSLGKTPPNPYQLCEENDVKTEDFIILRVNCLNLKPV